MRLSPHQELIVRSHTEEALEVEAVYQAGSQKPPVHLHPEQDEHFEVLAGEITAVVAGDERVHGAGDAFDIPRGTPHTMWNGSGEEVRVLWRTSPALDTLGWFQALAEAQESGDYAALGDAVQKHAREIRFV
jgi:mannose-6-phosphate isomerase-like protein (cupin superfamily)